MNEILVYVGLAVLGAAFGSFAGATVWRLRARQLVEDRQAGEKIDKVEYKRLLPLTKRSLLKDRSICLDTGKELPWYDLIPVVSWLVLRGRSRFSGKPIGYFEFAIEVVMLLFFVGSFAFWPHGFENWQAVTLFVLWLVSGVGLAILFVYDVKWFLLPDKVVYPLIGVGLVMASLQVSASASIASGLWSVLFAVLVLAGLYFVLHVVSKGKWVGFGDVKLGIFLGLALAQWPLAIVCLFLANLIGCLYVMPAMLTGKMQRATRVPFGPFLILGFVLAMLFGQNIINWYLSFTFGGYIAVVF